MTEEFKPGDIVSARLPGEGLWAKVVGRLKTGRYRGHLRVLLQNESLHRGFSWGQSVVLDEYHYVITPKHAVAAAEMEAWGCDRKTHEEQMEENEKEVERRHEAVMQTIEKMKEKHPELWEEVSQGLDAVAEEEDKCPTDKNIDS